MIKKILIRRARRERVDDRLITLDSEKKYFIEDISKDYHCSDGVFKKDDLKKTAQMIKSSKDKEFYIIDASFIDSFRGIRKTAQTIPLKDLGFMLAELGVDKKSVIVDAGAGSGASACFIARYAKKVYTFDISETNLEQARKNVKYFGLKNVVIKKQDVYQNIPVKNADAIILDLPEPWNAIVSADKSLKCGGFIIAYCPQITQIQQFVNELMKKNYLHLKTVEIIERDWKVEGQIVRPRSLSNIHSGFIVVVRKIN